MLSQPSRNPKYLFFTLVRIDLPALKKIEPSGGEMFSELGELVVESEGVGGKSSTDVPKLEEVGGWYIFQNVYKLTAASGGSMGVSSLDAPKFQDVVEDHSDMLWTSKSTPFSLTHLSSTIADLVISRYSGNDMNSLTISGFPELASISIGHHSFARVVSVEICDLPRLSLFHVEHDCFLTDAESSSFVLRRCPALRSFSMEKNVCMYFRHFALESVPEQKA